MPLPIGSRVGPYEVVSAIGEGGMGQVYRARDSRLSRDVALKVLHASVATDPDRLRRFTIEAQAVAALNHPNVLTIFEVGSHEGHPFLATELLEGETLRERMTAGALPYSKAIDIARQTADGLAAAHAKGIAHRDLKPENLFLTTDGRVKILDFGLAKSVAGAATDAGATASDTAEATRLQAATSAGMILGTAGYMSPEQIRARPVDHRTDIFSLGIVLYELLTGRRPFAGDSAVETMNAILTSDPPEMTTSGVTISPAATPIVRHCLEKNPDERFQSARDLSFALQSLASASGATLPLRSGQTSGAALAGAAAATDADARSKAGPRWGLIAATALLGAIAGAAAMWIARPAPPAVDLTSARFIPLATEAEAEHTPVWSRDGRSLAYLKDTQIMVRALDADEPTAITAGNSGAETLFWFPDNTRIGYAANGVWSVSRAGGDPERIQEGWIYIATLSPDGGTLAFWKLTTEGTRRTAALWYASPPNGPAKKYEGGLVDVPALSPVFLAYSPDGKWLAYSGYEPSPGVSLISIGADGAPSGAPKRLFASTTFAAPPQVAWLPDNRTVLIASGGSSETEEPGIWVGDIERDSLTKITAGVESLHSPDVSPDGRRIAVTAGAVDYDLIVIPLNNDPVVSLLATSRDEVGGVWTGASEIAYVSDKGGAQEIRLRHLADGRERVVAGPRAFSGGTVGLSGPAVSPDGARVLFSRFDGRQGAMYVAPVGGTPVRLTSGTGMEWMGTWSPDGREVAFATIDAGTTRLLRQRLGSTEPPRVILNEVPSPYGCMLEWSPTGEWIAHDRPDGLWLVSPDGKERKLAPDRALAVAWSRDGRTLFALRRPASGESVARQPVGIELASIDVSSGQARVLRRLDPAIQPAAPLNPGLRLSLNADGTRLLTTVARPRENIWVIER